MPCYHQHWSQGQHHLLLAGVLAARKVLRLSVAPAVGGRAGSVALGGRVRWRAAQLSLRPALAWQPGALPLQEPALLVEEVVARAPSPSERCRTAVGQGAAVAAGAPSVLLGVQAVPVTEEAPREIEALAERRGGLAEL
mmetsp:Transcript_27215/g.86462  ORF Transcript_27215/g.86462 Transcript_27215/m.86462 type:complete len:139 (+) Transcript_27215:763-1179(+)